MRACLRWARRVMSLRVRLPSPWSDVAPVYIRSSTPSFTSFSPPHFPVAGFPGLQLQVRPSWRLIPHSQGPTSPEDVDAVPGARDELFGRIASPPVGPSRVVHRLAEGFLPSRFCSKPPLHLTCFLTLEQANNTSSDRNVVPQVLVLRHTIRESQPLYANWSGIMLFYHGSSSRSL